MIESVSGKKFLDLGCGVGGNVGKLIELGTKSVFGVAFYHSYYKFDGMICDLNNNVVMSEEDFNLLNEPEVISVLTYEEYKDKIETLNSTLMPLLEIALSKSCDK